MEKFLKLKCLLLLALTSSSIAEEIKCKFSYKAKVFNSFARDFYECEMDNVFEEPTEATSVTGNHIESASNGDVTVFYVTAHALADNTKYYPTKMCTQLINLKKIMLWSPDVLEINRDIFRGCKELTDISIYFSKLKKLDDDLFADVPTLKSLSIINTKLEILQENIFENNPAIETVNLSGNKLKIIETDFPKNLKLLTLLENLCINTRYDEKDNQSTPLDEVIKQVEENCNKVSR